MTSSQLTAGVEATSLDRLIQLVGAVAAKKYRRYVSFTDICQELWVYSLGDGRKFVDRQLRNGKTFRVKRALFGVAKAYSERQKAALCGYEFDDVVWYTPSQIADLIDLALDSDYDGLTGESADAGMPRQKSQGQGSLPLLDMLIDIRRAISALKLSDDPGDYEMTDGAGLDRLVRIADWLGGEFPGGPGYGRGRRVLSRAAAAATVEDLT